MSKMDELMDKKKEVVAVLDLSKTVAKSKEEYKRLMERVPDFKMRPIKVRSDEIKINTKDVGFRTPKKELRYLRRHHGERQRLYQYMDPVPAEMRSVSILELCAVPIDWKMLTTLRSKSKMDTEYFSRLMELGKLQLKTEQRDKRELQLSGSQVRKCKNKSGIIETRPLTCAECSEEFCTGRSCCDFSYDLYTRVVPRPPARPKVGIPMQPEVAAILAGKSALGGGRAAAKKIGGGGGGQLVKGGGKLKRRTRSVSPGKMPK